MNTKNLAIMSTDIVGSSGTTAALDRTDYERFRGQYDRIVAPLIRRMSGELFKALGDGYLASFESSTNAVLAGLDIQAQLKSLIATLHLDQRYSTRIGIGSGDVTIEGTDRFGMPVIQATRVQAIAEPSSTFITESVFLTMNRNEVFCEDLGYISLKGLEDRTRVFRVEPKGQSSPAEQVAVFCTDLAEFTSSVDDGANVEHALAAYDEVIFKQALLHNGFFRYNVGDMYLITFKTAGDALRAAAAIFRHFWDLQDDRPLRPYLPQLGLDFGQVRNIRGRLYGSTLSRVAPALAHVSSTRIFASRRFLDQLQREDPSAAAPTPLWEMRELHVNGVHGPIEYSTLMSGEVETGLAE
jgi:class 3 adenylate cyclase